MPSDPSKWGRLVGVRLDKELFATVEQAAKANERDLSSQVRYWMKKGIEVEKKQYQKAKP